MSILIKGLEMPKSCYVCPFCDYVAARCNAVKGKPYTPESRYEKRADFCPLVPVPAHGDLIDKQYAYQNTMVMGEHMRKIILKQIDLLPTVIPAEEGE